MIKKLNVQDLTFAYDKSPVLKGISFDILPGRLVSLVGPNGSGKSTLLKCITCILNPFGGRILVDGREIKRLSRQETARTLAYVPQGIQRVFPHSVYDVVFMGRRPYLGWIGKSVDKEKVWSILELLGLVELALEPFTNLSGGQQQKVLIARALAQDTGLILLDEPTSNLDIWHQLDVLNIVRRLVDEKEVTVIMALHDLNLAAKYSDNILMMKNGLLTALGNPENVLSKSNIADVYHVDVHVDTMKDTRFVVPIRQCKTHH